LFIIGCNNPENDSHLGYERKECFRFKMISLIQAPSDTALRIADITGGYGVRRRLFALGFHKSDIIELDSRSILHGPVLVKNLTSDTSVALGRGIAQKIFVEIIEERK
jgi:Fe2+ transport system protein FeoA